MKDEYKFIALCVLAGIVAGVATTIILNNFLPKSEAQTYREFYATETLVSVSPSDYLDDLKAGKWTARRWTCAPGRNTRQGTL